MLKAIKYELKLNKTQEQKIKRTCGCCRLVYNTMLSRKIEAYKKDKTNISSYDLINQLVTLKQEKSFLKDVPSQALQQAILNFSNPRLKSWEKVRQNNGLGFGENREFTELGNWLIDLVESYKTTEGLTLMPSAVCEAIDELTDIEGVCVIWL